MERVDVVRIALDDAPVALGRRGKVSELLLFDLRNLVEQHPLLGGVRDLREPTLVEASEIAKTPLGAIKPIEHGHRLRVVRLHL